jgi:hypothetical protein
VAEALVVAEAGAASESTAATVLDATGAPAGVE